MILTERSKDGNIRGVIDWWIGNPDGSFNPQGNYIWVNQLEISKAVNGESKEIISRFIKKICKLCPQARFGYFKREKHNGRIRMYSRNKWLKFAEKYGGEV